MSDITCNVSQPIMQHKPLLSENIWYAGQLHRSIIWKISIGGVHMILDSFITWDFLGQYMGVVIVTMILVQFVKELPWIKKIPTKYLTAIIAFITLLSAQIGAHKFSWDGELYLIFLNSILVTMTATGGWDFANKKVQVDNSTNNSPILQPDVTRQKDM